MLEAASFGARHLIESIQEAGGEGKRFIAVGGGTKGGLWPQIVSDICGVEQIIPKRTIGASYGDALISAQNVGAADESTSWMKPASIVYPDPDNKIIYDEFFASYLELYPATKGVMHFLTESQLDD